MSESPMPWIKLETRKLHDARLGQCSDSAYRLYFDMYMLAGLLDAGGRFIRDGQILTDDQILWELRRIGPDEAKKFKKHIGELKAHSLLTQNGHGYEINEFLEVQGPTQHEKREEWKARQAKHREEKSANVTPKKSNGHKSVTGDNGMTGLPVTPQTRAEQTKSREDKSRQEQSNSGAVDHRGLLGAEELQKINTKLIEAGYPDKKNPDRADPAKVKTASACYAIWHTASLGNPKLLEICVLLAIRSNVTEAINLSLSTLAAAYSNQRVNNKPVIAYTMAKDGRVSDEYTKPGKWHVLDYKIIEAAGIRLDRIYDLCPRCKTSWNNCECE